MFENMVEVICNNLSYYVNVNHRTQLRNYSRSHNALL